MVMYSLLCEISREYGPDVSKAGCYFRVSDQSLISNVCHIGLPAAMFAVD